MRTGLRITAILITLLFVCVMAVSAQGGSSPSVTYTTEPAYNPATGNVTLSLVVQDAGYLTPTDLSEIDFELDAPHTGLTVSTSPDLPLALAIIVDASAGSNISLIRDTLTAYFEYYYRPDDQVTMYIVDLVDPQVRSFRQETITSLNEAREVLSSLETGASYFSVRAALDAALADLLALGSSPYLPRQALFIGSFLNRPMETQFANDFADANIPLHVIQAHYRHDAQTSVYRRLALNGGGVFVNNQYGLFVLSDTFEPVNLLKVLYDTIGNNRLIYTLGFRPTHFNVTQPQAVGLTVSLPRNNIVRVVQSEFAYALNLLSPAVAFADPSELQVALSPTYGSSGILRFDQDTQPITLNVSFPDQVERTLALLTLAVQDAESGATLQTIEFLNPQVDETGALAVVWPLDTLRQLESTDITLLVEVTDEAGLVGSATESGSIELPAVPAAAVVVPSALMSVQQADATSGDGSGTFALFDNLQNDPTTQALLAVNLVLLVVALFLGGVAVVRRRRAPAPVIVPATPVSAPRPEPTPEETPTETIEPEDAPTPEPTTFAQLIVREGLEESGPRQVPMRQTRFVIGRAATCDLVLDLPYVSPEHCTILWHNDRPYVRDLGSKNGTFVNGERVSADSEIDAPIGSEISITRHLIIELRRAEYELLTTDESAYGSTAYSTAAHDAVELQRLPGLRYAPDSGPDIDEDYSPF
jgi:pSer/pThr/pTyr-binding forkhead associated (FHA) protein